MKKVEREEKCRCLVETGDDGDKTKAECRQSVYEWNGMTGCEAEGTKRIPPTVRGYKASARRHAQRACTAVERHGLGVYSPCLGLPVRAWAAVIGWWQGRGGARGMVDA